MLFTEFNMDVAKEVWLEEGRQEGIEIGEQKGIQKGRQEILKQLRQMGIPEEKIQQLSKSPQS